MTVASHKNVFGLEITMEDAPIVCGNQPTHNLQRVLDRLPYRQQTGVQPRAQALAIQQFGNDIRRFILPADIEHRQDIRVV